MLAQHQPLAILALLAASVTQVSAKGCYKGGVKFNELKGGSVNGAIDYFCDHVRKDPMPPWTSVEKCFAFPENNSGGSMKINLWNGANVQRGLSAADCKKYLQTEKGACDHGSEQEHAGLQFIIDPNGNKC